MKTKKEDRPLGRCVSHIKNIKDVIILADALRKIAACPVHRGNKPEVMGQALHTMRTYAKAALREANIKE